MGELVILKYFNNEPYDYKLLPGIIKQQIMRDKDLWEKNSRFTLIPKCFRPMGYRTYENSFVHNNKHRINYKIHFHLSNKLTKSKLLECDIHTVSMYII